MWQQGADTLLPSWTAGGPAAGGRGQAVGAGQAWIQILALLLALGNTLHFYEFCKTVKLR